MKTSKYLFFILCIAIHYSSHAAPPVLKIKAVSQPTVYRPGEKISLKISSNQAIEFRGEPQLEIKTKSKSGQEDTSQVLKATLLNNGELSVSFNVPKHEGTYKSEIKFKNKSGQVFKTQLGFVVIDPSFGIKRPEKLKKVLIEKIDCSQKYGPDKFLEHGDSTIEKSALGSFRYTGRKSTNVFPPLGRKK